MTSRTPSRMNGIRKAAILMAVMGEEAASTVYKNLSEKRSGGCYPRTCGVGKSSCGGRARCFGGVDELGSLPH